MQVFMNAVYKDGVLVPDRSLGADKEGKKFKVILVEEDRPAGKREHFFKFAEAHTFLLPEDYRVDRDELYER